MTEPGRGHLTLLGVALAVAGAVGSVLFLLQPWASCPEIDDSSAGCPVDTTGVVGLLGMVGLLLVGLVLLAVGLLRRAQPST